MESPARAAEIEGYQVPVPRPLRYREDMSVLDLDTATWTEVRDLLAAVVTGRRVVILPCGATEAHGPHLGLSTDVTIAVAMAREGARRLALDGWTVLLAPPIAYTPVTWAGAFPGSVGPSPETFRRLVVELVSGLAGWDVDVVAIANSHFDPSAIAALRDAVIELEEAAVRVAFPDLTRRGLAARLGEEFLSGACHAGSYETSIVLAARPELARPAIAVRLSALNRSLVVAMAEGATDFISAGAPEAWVGRPAEASPAEGEKLIAELGLILAETVLAVGNETAGGVEPR